MLSPNWHRKENRGEGELKRKRERKGKGGKMKKRKGRLAEIDGGHRRAVKDL